MNRMNCYQMAIDAWSDYLGAENVATQDERVAEAETATFKTAQKIPAIIYPKSNSQVQQCVRIAGTYKIPIYPISRGKNWGLGSRVPVQDDCVLLDLSRMNRIVGYDDELAYITVEPGVTFRQAAIYLQERNSRHFIAVTGGPPDSSLIGNAMERGDGIGPLGDRFSHCCDMEIVLPSGDCIQTGYSRFPGAKVGKLTRWGIGPHLDGLFSQSNLGIVTRMSFWLQARPDWFQSLVFTVRDMSQLNLVIDNLNQLQAQGVVKANSVAVWNVYKMIASDRQYPWEITGDQTPLPLEKIKQIRSPWGKSEWVGIGGIYSPSKQHARADRKIIKKMLGSYTDRMFFINGTKARVARWLDRPLNWLTGIDVQDTVKALYDQSVFLGFPTEKSTRSTYWRKKLSIPRAMDPEGDRCGIIWLCPVVPFMSNHLSRAINIAQRTAEEFGFEPQIAFIFPSERAIYMFPSIVYDRDVSGEDEKAIACHDKMLNSFLSAGYYPYRLGIQSMAALAGNESPYDELVGRIKHLLDPDSILSPGRYEFYASPISQQQERSVDNRKVS